MQDFEGEGKTSIARWAPMSVRFWENFGERSVEEPGLKRGPSQIGKEQREAWGLVPYSRETASGGVVRTHTRRKAKRNGFKEELLIQKERAAGIDWCLLVLSAQRRGGGEGKQGKKEAGKRQMGNYTFQAEGVSRRQKTCGKWCKERGAQKFVA